MQGFNQLNKAFDSRVRLGLMSILVVNDWVSYKEIKENLSLTDGNLASHVSSLERIKYVEIKKQFVGKKPQTSYKVTKSGRKAFADHIDGLEKILKGQYFFYLRLALKTKCFAIINRNIAFFLISFLNYCMLLFIIVK